ncbi:MAG TPA: TolC family protein [Tepidisphaeraceae bacterium]|nr:TolC family protein [Tepidisphaeraceae bacterium]
MRADGGRGFGRSVDRRGCGAALVACALALVAGGCAVDQKAEVAKYRSILDADSGGPVERPAAGEPLTLVHALRLANQDNERLAIAGEDFVQAWAEKDRAFAGFLPTLSFGPSYNVVDASDAPRQTTTDSNGQARPVGASGGFKQVGQTLRRFEAPVNLSANLFRGFGDLASFEAAVQSIELRRQLLLDARSTLLLQVADTYYQVLRFERTVAVLRQSLQAQTERVRDARTRLDAGIGSTLEMAQSQAQEASTRARLVLAQGSVTSARTLLAFLIGTSGTITGPLRDDYDIPADVGPVEALVQLGWDRREDLRAAVAAVTAARANVNAAVAEYYPSVTLNINGFLVRENFETASKWNALLQVNLPLFTGGLIEADVRRAWSVLRQRAMEESLLRRQIEQEIRTRYEDLRTSRASLAEFQAQIRAASEAFRQSRAGLAAGTAITLDVLTAQDVLLQAQLEEANEEFLGKFRYLDLLRATGGLTLNEVRRATSRPTPRPATP